MLRPDFSLSGAAPALPEFERIAPATSRGAGFSALMKDVSSEVRDFIENGSSSMSLSTSGQAYRLRSEAAAAAAAGAPAAETASASPVAAPGATGEPGRKAFLATIAPWVNDTAERLGVAPEIVAAQAALESGWGQRPVRDAQGRDSHNLFGIKAGAAWQGDVAAALTTEFEGGVGVRRTEPFRSYPDYASAFRDFTRLLTDNPRYQGALNVGSDVQAYAQALVRGGYATDPGYADKLARLAGQLQRPD